MTTVTLALHSRIAPSLESALDALEQALISGAQFAELGFEGVDNFGELILFEPDADFAGGAGDLGYVFEPTPALFERMSALRTA